MLEDVAADAHVLGGGKVYQPEAVVVCQLVDVETQLLNDRKIPNQGDSTVHRLISLCILSVEID